MLILPQIKERKLKNGKDKRKTGHGIRGSNAHRQTKRRTDRGAAQEYQFTFKIKIAFS